MITNITFDKDPIIRERQYKEMNKQASSNIRDNISADLSRAGLYEKVYQPSFDKAESLLTSGYKGKRYGKNEWEYALSRVNKSKVLGVIGKKYGHKISIVDTGPSENNWKFTMNKQAFLKETYNSAFNDELEKVALSGKDSIDI